jgi:hypothetical protein
MASSASATPNCRTSSCSMRSMRIRSSSTGQS